MTQLSKHETRRDAMMAAALAALLLGSCLGGQAHGQLQSYWTFDDGTVTDVVGANNGVDIAGAAFSADAPPVGGTGSLDLTNAADYVTLPTTNYNIVNQFTLAAWVKRNGAGSGRFFSVIRDLTSGDGDRSGINLGINQANVYGGLIMLSEGGDPANNGVDTFHDYTTTGTTTGTVDPDTWTHVVMTLKDDFMKLYVDGVPETVYAPGGGAGFDTGQLKPLAQGQDIDFVDDDGSFSGFGADGRVPGGGPANDTAHYDGFLDEVAVWNVALNPLEVMRLASGATNPITALDPPPGGRGDFNNDGGTDLLDYEILRMNFFRDGVLFADGDINFDGRVDLFDFREFKAAFAEANPPVPASSVPEPGTLLLAVSGAALLGSSRRRRGG